MGRHSAAHGVLLLTALVFTLGWRGLFALLSKGRPAVRAGAWLGLRMTEQTFTRAEWAIHPIFITGPHNGLAIKG